MRFLPKDCSGRRSRLPSACIIRQTSRSIHAMTKPASPNIAFTLADHALHLQSWVMIRSLVLLLLATTAGLCVWFGTIALPVADLIIPFAILALVNLLTFSRLKQKLPVTEIEFFIQLLIDICCLTAVFYFSGGANNPFVSYFLVPVCVAAATIRQSLTFAISTLSVLSYSLLLFFFEPLPALTPQHHSAGHGISLHLLGMWFNFFISASLVTYFVVKMAREIRLQDAQLNRWREDQLRDEQVMAVATLAAGTAHELGTPLSTMKVLLSELTEEYAENESLLSDLRMLQAQINQCADTLRTLVQKAEQAKDGNIEPQSVMFYCEAIIERWRLIRPDIQSTVRVTTQQPELCAIFPPTIEQAILNLLNNAADASKNRIMIKISWDFINMVWVIEDDGPGIAEEISAHLGRSFISTKNEGMGIGLLLTQATISRHGGTVTLHKRKQGGTLTRLQLPLIRQL